MKRIVLNEQMRALFDNLEDQIELTDEHGTVLAHVKPKYSRELLDEAAGSITLEELDRRDRAPGAWRTTKEVMERLRSS